ncbi:MAG: redoxin family protein [Anaerolineae bacterium]
MNCPNCQMWNRPGAKVCSRCGYNLVAGGQAQGAVPGGGYVPPPQPAPQGGYPQQGGYPPQGGGYPQPGPWPGPARAPWYRRIPWGTVGRVTGLLLIGFALGLAAGWLLFGQSGASGASTTDLPDLKLKDVDNKDRDFASLAKDKPAVLAFWVSDLGQDAQIDTLQKLASANKIVAVVVDPDESRTKVGNYVKSKKWDKVIFLIDTDGAAKQRLGVSSLPTYWLFTKDGTKAAALDKVAPDELETDITNQILK